MKKIIIVTLLLFSMSLGSFAQRGDGLSGFSENLPFLDQKTVHWGFSVGLNRTEFTVFKNDLLFHDTSNVFGIESKPDIVGFFIGPIFNLRAGKYVDIRLLLDISFTQRNFVYHIAKPDKTGYEEVNINIPSSFIEMPVLLKFKGKRFRKNLRPYVVVGSSLKYDLASLRKINKNEPNLRLKPFDAYLELGPGFDFYLPYFKFSIELKYSNGFFNVLQKENTMYSKPIDALKSHAFMLSFHFEG